MDVSYFFETDCYTLNRKARFHYPFYRQLVDLMERYFGLNLFNQNIAHSEADEDVKKKLVQKVRMNGSLVDWEQNLQDASFVVFDTETTGLQPFKGDRIISIAGVITENGFTQNDTIFDKLVNPGRPIPTTASHITGITNAMVSDKPNIISVLLDFFTFTEGRILVAHNAAFDLAFLNVALSRCAPCRVLNPVIDTYTLAKSLLPDMFDYSLERLVNRFDTEEHKRHTALGDSIMTAHIFARLLEMLEKKQVYTLNHLCHFFSSQRDSYRKV